MGDLTNTGLAGVMEGVKKELEKEKTIKCPKKECGHENPKHCLTCEKCGERLFGNHKSSEEKAITKKAKKTLEKKKAEKKGEKKEGKAKAKEKAKGPAKPKGAEEYPKKGSVREKVLNVVKKHPEGITMPEIQKELKIVYRVDSYTQEMEERKLIKTKKEGIERTYFPL